MCKWEKILASRELTVGWRAVDLSTTNNKDRMKCMPSTNTWSGLVHQDTFTEEAAFTLCWRVKKIIQRTEILSWQKKLCMQSIHNKQKSSMLKKYENCHWPWTLHIGIGCTGNWSLRRTVDITHLRLDLLLKVTRGWICKLMFDQLPSLCLLSDLSVHWNHSGSYWNC